MNSKYDQLAKTFKKLSHKDKKQKVVNMMNYIKDKVNFAEWMEKFISQAIDVSDTFLENIYQVVMAAAIKSWEQANDEKSQKLLEHIQTIASQHQQKEDLDRQNAEDIISNL